MKRCTTLQATVLVCALLAGCSAANIRTWDEDGGSAGPDPDAGPAAPSADSGTQPSAPDATPPAPDTIKTPPAKVDTGAPAAACPNGNLLAAYPALAALCRPFPAAQPSAVLPEPAYCATGAKVALSEGANSYSGTETVKDWISGMGGADTLKGLGCSDIINGNMGNDYINGNMGNDLIRGGQGNDTIRGGQGNDSLYGDLDNDTVMGDLGDDTYYFAQGEGMDVVEDSGGYDTFLCSAHAGRARPRLLSWSKTGVDLLLVLSGGGTVRVKNFYTSAASSIDAIINCQ